VVRLDPPVAIPADEDFHQLGLDYAVGRYGDPTGHGFDATYFVVDIHYCHIGREKANAPDDVAFRGALVEGAEDLGVPLGKGGLTVHDHPEKIGK
jgi:hypothetical protein